MRLLTLEELAKFLYDWSLLEERKTLSLAFLEHYKLQDMELENTPHARYALRLILNRYVSD